MKRILYILLLCTLNLILKAQTPIPANGGYPIKQNLGADSTQVMSKGSLSGRFINYNFTDTTAANLQRIRQYPGAQIFTTSDTSIWLRTPQADAWVKVKAGGGTITFFDFLTDSSLVICYSDGSCDTLSFTNIFNITDVTFNTDSSLVICYASGSCDTIALYNFDTVVNNIIQNFIDTSTTINNITNISNGCNSLLEGGLVSWADSLLIFDVTAARYNINCTPYTSEAGQVELDPGGADPRFDAIYVDTTGAIGVIKGTESANPELPQGDPASQLILTYVFVDAGATTPSEIFTETIYDENLGTPTEWTAAASAWATTDLGSTANPYHFVTSISVSNTGTVNSSSNMVFTAADTLRVAQGWQFIKFYLYLNSSANANQGFQFSWLNSSGTLVSNLLFVLPTAYTFNRTLTGTYQQVVIPMSSFVFTDTGFSKLVIRPINGIKNFYIDWITMQGGGEVDQNSGVFIHNQYQGARIENFWMSGVGRTDGWFTSPGTSGSEKFGYGSQASAGSNAFGQNAVAASNGVSIGYSSQSSNSIAIGNYVNALSGSVVVGHGGTSTGTGVTNVGLAINSTAGNQVNVGQGHVNSGVYGITVGYYNRVSTTFGTAIGFTDTVSHASSYIFGSQLGTTANYQLLFGNGDRNSALGLTDVYFGSGVTNNQAKDFSINITGEEGTDVAGHILNISSGKGTGAGAAASSYISLKTPTATTSGTTLQSLAERVRITNTGILVPNGIMPTSGSGGTDSVVYRNSSTGDFYLGEGSSITSANNGLSLSAGVVRLGQSIGAVGDPAKLLGNMEIPLDNYLFSISDGGVTLFDIGGGAWNFFAGNINNTGIAADDATGVIEIQSNGYVSIKDDAANERLRLNTATGQLRLNNYGSGTFTGTDTYWLAVDANGNVIEESAPTSTNIYNSNGSLDDYRTLTAADKSLTMTFNSIDSSGLIISSTSTAAANDRQRLIDVSLSGANSNSAQSTYGIYSTNTHTGSGNTKNYGGYFNASGSGYANYGIFATADGGAAVAVYGNNNGTGNGTGVYGQSITGIGVFGTASGANGIAIQGSNTTTSGTGYGIQGITTGAKTTGIAGYFSATGATNNYAIIVPDASGNVGIGTSSPTATRLEVVDNSVAGASIVNISTTSTAAASNLQKGVNVSLSGANATASQTTYGIYASNTHTGTTPINVGIYGEASGNATSKGVYGVASSGAGVRGSGTWGIYGESSVTAAIYGVGTSSAYGVYALSASVPSILSVRDEASTNTVITTFESNRGSTGTAADGIGQSFDFKNELDNGTYAIANQLTSKWTTAANATRTSQFIVSGVNSAATGDIISFEGNKRTILYGRLLQQQGADVASAAGAIALGLDGNVFEITGTDAITLISNLNWQNGSVIHLVFTSTASLTDGTANSGTDIGMELAGGANFTGSADDVITLVLSEVGGTQRWREVSRSVN